ncbi:Uma2 family endonuclease [Methylobacterium sp. WL6]|uniref:Uma2 family endonuclease n=1 Tax=Methylobacterium sp. WL6 TaxID=2603901 RepID=UPI0011CA830B|nr:Uma2 family endonuclease [Methylobacterium sp. WL6]TXN65323.1 Uma2 family endonuclease [Methylobacterium sp. WL6]
MSVKPTPRMTVDEFLAWGEGRPGRHELLDGEVFAMSPERVRHAETKFAAQLALRAVIRREGLPCQVLPDGMTIRIERTTAFEPDALVRCGPRLDPDTVEVTDPVIVVDVLSPSTRSIDTGAKFAGYFGIPSVMHYLLIDTVKRLAVHHHRRADDVIETRIVSDGVLTFDPPGITVPLAELYDDA